MIPIRDDNPTHKPAVLTLLLIGVCVLVFLWQLTLPDEAEQRLVYALGLIPAVLLGGQQLPPDLAMVPSSLTLVTSMFLHGGFAHLIGNMLYLWIFGDNIENVLGIGRFMLFYLLCGLAAAFAQALPAPDSTIPMIGASGAISGVLGAYLVLFPSARVLTVIPFGFYLHTVKLPALLVLGLWFGLQLLNNLTADPNAAGVAWRAHIGGFIAGMVLILLMKPRRVSPFRQR